VARAGDGDELGELARRRAHVPTARLLRGAQKLKTTVSNELIKHAKIMNVLIIRTIDLLILMRQLEENEQRGEIMLDIMKSGGGFLKVYYENSSDSSL
jgi:hypothetical protein